MVGQKELVKTGNRLELMSNTKENSFAMVSFMMTNQMRKKHFRNHVFIQGRICTYFTMSFSYDFELDKDTVQFCYCIPYSYSKLK